MPGDKQLFIPVGFYKGCKVAIKRIHASNITINREQMLELKRVSVCVCVVCGLLFCTFPNLFQYK